MVKLNLTISVLLGSFMWNKDKVRKIKTYDDVITAHTELMNHAHRVIDLSTLTLQEMNDLFDKRVVSVDEYIEWLSHQGTFETRRKLNEVRFKNGLIEYDAFMKTDFEIDKDEAIDLNSRREIGSSLNRNSDVTIDPYILSNIEYKFEKAMLDLEFRMGSIDNYEYELKMADLNNDPYAKVIFEPDVTNSSQLTIDARFNDIFVQDLSERDGLTPKFDDDGGVDKDDLVEQWFHTAVIVLGANMLRETDLDTFRSLSADNPGVPIVEKLEFDSADLNDLNEIERKQIEEITEHGRIYR